MLAAAAAKSWRSDLIFMVAPIDREELVGTHRGRYAA
jgi:hypothetical protein